jgi:hypothetical protein
MALLHLPLTLTPSGVFERSTTEEDTTGSRLRMFLLAGMGEYLRLPSPGVRAVWTQLYTMGRSSRFCNQLDPQARKKLEKIIAEELNTWLEGTAMITDVKLLGDDKEENGLLFRTSDHEFVFRFQFAQAGRGLKAGSIGSWNITETSHAIG